MFDLIVRGGRIVDGSGGPWFRGDVGIVGDRIASRTEPGPKRRNELTVFVASAAWAQELSLLVGEIIPRLKAAGVEVSGRLIVAHADNRSEPVVDLWPVDERDVAHGRIVEVTGIQNSAEVPEVDAAR